MNSRKWAHLLLICLAAGCGVKGPPSPPKGSALPSYQDKFLYPDGKPPAGKSKDKKQTATENEVLPTSDESRSESAP